MIYAFSSNAGTSKRLQQTLAVVAGVPRLLKISLHYLLKLHELLDSDIFDCICLRVEVKNETNKSGGGQGQMTAWKGSKDRM